MPTVGFIGGGAIGRALIARLKETSDALYRILAYDPSPMAQSLLLELGVELRASPAEVAQASHIIEVAVPSDPEVEEVCLGDKGIGAGLAGHHPFVVLHSTVAPSTTRQVAAQLGKDAVVLDCPVVGVPQVARAGEAVFLAGGENAAVQALTPHLLRMGRAVLYMGPLGMGNLAKLVKNLISGAERFVWYEALQLAAAGGLDPSRLGELIATVSEPGRLAATVADWQRHGRIAPPATANSWYHKDFRLAEEVGQSLGLALPITQALQHVAEVFKVRSDEATPI